MSETKPEIMDVINNINSIDENNNDEIVLFDDAAVQPVFETPFADSRPARQENRVAFRSEIVNEEDNLTIIGATTNLIGNLTVDGTLEIRGKIKGDLNVVKNITINGGEIEGNISCENLKNNPGASKVIGDIVAKNDVFLNESKVMKGNISAKNASVAGHLEGNVDCNNSLIICKTATIDGNITAATFQVESGAQINGQVSIKH